MLSTDKFRRFVAFWSAPAMTPSSVKSKQPSQMVPKRLCTTWVVLFNNTCPSR